MKVQYRVNLWAGVISVVCGFLLLLLIPGQVGSEYSSNYGITSKSIPGAVALIFIVCGGGLVIQSLVFKKDSVKELALKKEGIALCYMAVLGLFLFLLNYSFVLASALLGVATLAFTGSKKKWYYVIVLVTVLFLYVIFTQILHVQLK